jgi:hypothetical protein
MRLFLVFFFVFLGLNAALFQTLAVFRASVRATERFLGIFFVVNGQGLMAFITIHWVSPYKNEAGLYGVPASVRVRP